MKAYWYILSAVIVVALWSSHTATAATNIWSYNLPAGSVINDIVPDGKGGVVVCYNVSATTNAMVLYLDKKGELVWQEYFSQAYEAYADYLAKKSLVVVVYTRAGRFEAYQMTLGAEPNTVIVAKTAGIDYTFGPTTPPDNKDTKGFFLVKRIVATGALTIQRYNYK